MNTKLITQLEEALKKAEPNFNNIARHMKWKAQIQEFVDWGRDYKEVLYLSFNMEEDYGDPETRIIHEPVIMSKDIFLYLIRVHYKLYSILEDVYDSIKEDLYQIALQVFNVIKENFNYTKEEFKFAEYTFIGGYSIEIDHGFGQTMEIMINNTFIKKILEAI